MRWPSESFEPPAAWACGSRRICRSSASTTWISPSTRIHPSRPSASPIARRARRRSGSCWRGAASVVRWSRPSTNLPHTLSSADPPHRRRARGRRWPTTGCEDRRYRRRGRLVEGHRTVRARGGGARAAPTTAPATTGPSETTAPTDPGMAPLSGSLTIWHAYGSSGGSAEFRAFSRILEDLKAKYPDLQIEAIEQDFGQLYTNFETES